MSDKTIKIYQLNNKPNMVIKPGSRERIWMDETRDNHAYRCLPLTIANQHGWAVHVKDQVSFLWNGGPSINDVKVKSSNKKTCAAIFGQGIVTFHIEHLIRPPDNYNLYITGPPNYFKPGIAPLTGIFEADWAPYSFTMNWQITEPNKEIVFDEGEPICFFFPVLRGDIDQFELKYDTLSSDPEFEEQYNIFYKSRGDFVKDKMEGLIDGKTWQKHYFQGKYPDESKCPIHNHQTKINLKDIEK